MPKVFQFGKYTIFFWSNENDEPLHVHVCEGTPSPNATKIWITRSGRCIVAHNKGRIPSRELLELQEVISAQFFLICRKWADHFATDEIRYYC